MIDTGLLSALITIIISSLGGWAAAYWGYRNKMADVASKLQEQDTIKENTAEEWFNRHIEVALAEFNEYTKADHQALKHLQGQWSDLKTEYAVAKAKNEQLTGDIAEIKKRHGDLDLDFSKYKLSIEQTLESKDKEIQKLRQLIDRLKLIVQELAKKANEAVDIDNLVNNP